MIGQCDAMRDKVMACGMQRCRFQPLRILSAYQRQGEGERTELQRSTCQWLCKDADRCKPRAATGLTAATACMAAIPSSGCRLPSLHFCPLLIATNASLV